MLSFRGLARLVAMCAFVSFAPLPAQAQTTAIETPPSSLKLPTIVASAAAGADWATTYHALKYYRVREMNPLLRPFDHTPGKLVSIGALMDVGAVSAWNVSVGRDHPRIAAAGLWAMAGFRAYLAIHNLRNTQKAARR